MQKISQSQAGRAPVLRRPRAKRLLPQPQPQVVPSRRRVQATDLINIVGLDIDSQGHRMLSRGCRQLALNAKVELPGCHPAGIRQAITHWHRIGRFGEHTHVVLDAHGWFEDGKHWMRFPDGDKARIQTLEVIRLLREGGREFGHEDWQGCIEIHLCDTEQLRHWLEQVGGLHLLYGEGGPVITRLAWYMTGRILPLLKQKKEGQAGDWAQTLFEHVKQAAPMAVAMVGAGIKTMLSHVRIPADLQGRQVDLLDAFANCVMTGKAEHVQQFIELDRGLLRMRCDAFSSPFGAAVAAERWETVALLLNYPEVNWEEERSALLRLALRCPEDARLLDRSMQAFERKATRMTAPVREDAGQMRELMLELCLDHMLDSLQDLDSARLTALARELSQRGQSSTGFAVVWQLLTRTVAAATRLCALGHGEEAEDFRRALRTRLAQQLAVQAEPED